MKAIESNLTWYREHLQPLSRAIQRKKTEEASQLEYWIDYAFEVGDLSHLRQDNEVLEDMYFFSYLDLDVKILFLAFVTSPLLLFGIFFFKRLREKIIHILPRSLLV